MAFAGGFGAQLDLSLLSVADDSLSTAARLFSESNTRFLCEVAPDQAEAFEKQLAGIPVARIGQTDAHARLVIQESPDGRTLIDADIAELKQAWQQPLNW